MEFDSVRPARISLVRIRPDAMQMSLLVFWLGKIQWPHDSIGGAHAGSGAGGMGGFDPTQWDHPPDAKQVVDWGRTMVVWIWLDDLRWVPVWADLKR